LCRIARSRESCGAPQIVRQPARQGDIWAQMRSLSASPHLAQS
jgi:hypothetical protein